MITACWNVFILPINIAFETQDKVTTIVNYFVDLCFFLDIIVVFRTTILDEESGEEIKDAGIIAKTYLKGRFTIDFLSTVPFDSIALIFMDRQAASNFKLFGLLKLIRVLRLNRIIMYLNLKQDIKASIKLVKLIFFLLMYVHFIACIWFYIVNVKKEWIPPLDYIWGWDK
jgi:heme/copper-type cytochrome/quinol oxidase subunit 4